MKVQTVEQDLDIARLWWLGVAQGVVTLLFGIAALFWPGLTLVTLVYLFSAYVLIWGVTEIIRSLVGVKSMFGPWWLSLLFGIFAIGVGVYLVRHPLVSFATLILLIGFTFIIRGLFDVVESIFVNKTATGKVLGIIAGALAIVAGVFILNQPATGGVAFVWILGLYSLILGPVLIALSLDAKKLVEE